MKQLDSRSRVEIKIPNLYEGKELNCSITNQIFFDICKDLLEECGTLLPELDRNRNFSAILLHGKSTRYF
jgi:hypothetical protein